MPVGRRARITAIDDHADLLALLVEVLGEQGYVVTPIEGAPTSLAEVVRTRPDLLIVDLLLSDRPAALSGWDVVRLARADEALREVPIIVCSADIRQLRRREAEIAALPRVDVLLKPFGLGELERLVREMTVSNGNGGSAKAS